MIPEVFTGGWIRQGISLDDRPPAEDSVVWWLQTAVRHADLRVPHDPAGGSTSFAGTTTWDGHALTWVREIDLEGYDGEDVGTVAWDGPDLLESGTFESGNGPTAYTERWVRLPGSEGPLLSLRRGHERLLRAGSHAITQVDLRGSGGLFVATAWSLTQGGWEVHHTLPHVPLAPRPPVPGGETDGWVHESDGGGDGPL
ncbi:MAG: hypothetical protein ACJ72E_01265 [Marmoricola sp.]